MRIAALVALSLIFPVAAIGGGTSFRTRIHAFESEGKERYRIVIDWPQGQGRSTRAVLHLRHSRWAFLPHTPDFISRPNYLACIQQLQLHFQRREDFSLGRMAGGVLPIKGKKNEYQINSLSEMEEVDGQRVCYLFATTP